MSTPTLHVAPDFQLPIDAVTRRMAILAMSGAGKSNTAVVIAEAMFAAGMPWVAIDPKGDWWGVRSGRGGKGGGLPIPIFGGLHGDVPLEPSSGRLIGELIVDQRLTCVLDVSEFDTRQQLFGFLADLGETLLRRNRQAMHLFLEEADEYLPQKMGEKGNLPRCLGVWQRVVKRGRFRGLGTTQITQRSASLNKDTLYQAEVLIAMRAGGKGDRDAIRGWVEHHNASDEIVASLPTLKDGEAWVSSPAWLRQTTRVRFNRRRTFDSGATPVLLEKSARPATLADVNLEKIRGEMAATIERAKADDPAELRRMLAEKDKRIKQLERVESKASPVPSETQAPRIIEKKVIGPKEVGRLEGAVTNLERLGGVFADLIERADAIGQKARDVLADVQKTAGDVRQLLAPPAPANVVRGPETPDIRIHVPKPARPVKTATGGDQADAGELDAPKRAILGVVAMLGVRGIEASRDAVARWLDIHPNGGRYGSNLAWLRANGYMDGITLTDKGDATAPTMPTGLSGAKQPLDGPQQTIVDVLDSTKGTRYTRDTLAGALGIHPNGGRYGSNLARLRTMGLIPERGEIYLTEAAYR